MCICMCICIYIYAYVCLGTYVSVYTHTQKYICRHKQLYMCILDLKKCVLPALLKRGRGSRSGFFEATPHVRGAINALLGMWNAWLPRLSCNSDKERDDRDGLNRESEAIGTRTPRVAENNRPLLPCFCT